MRSRLVSDFWLFPILVELALYVSPAACYLLATEGCPAMELALDIFRISAMHAFEPLPFVEVEAIDVRMFDVVCIVIIQYVGPSGRHCWTSKASRGTVQLWNGQRQ